MIPRNGAPETQRVHPVPKIRRNIVFSFLFNFLTTPTIVLAVVALVGMLLQKKPLPEVFTGTIRTAVGLLALSVGSAHLGAELAPFTSLFAEVFQLEGVMPYDMALVGILQEGSAVVGRASAIILVVGFFGNLLLARVSPLKYIFLTGQLMWCFSIVVAFVLVEAGFSELMTVVIGSVAQALLLTITPAAAQPLMRRFTGENDRALGHFATLGMVASAWVGKAFGNPKKDAEDLKIPAGLSFFKDTAISVSLIMAAFFLVIAGAAGPERVAAYAGDQHYLVFAIMKAMGVAAGILVLMFGVQMFLDALIPAFRGIADKLVPGAIPALDIPAYMSLSPNALLIGFVTCTIGLLVGMLPCGAIFGVVPIVAVNTAFFVGGMAGILGNAVGGLRGAAVAGLTQGILNPLLVGATYWLFDFTGYGVEGLAMGSSDVIILATLLRSPWLGLGILAAAFLGLCALEVRRNRRLSQEGSAAAPAKEELSSQVL